MRPIFLSLVLLAVPAGCGGNDGRDVKSAQEMRDMKTSNDVRDMTYGQMVSLPVLDGAALLQTLTRDEVAQLELGAFQFQDKGPHALMGTTIRELIELGRMTYDPSADAVDEPLAIDDSTLAQLRSFRAEPKFLDLPGNIPGERARLTAIFDELLDRLIAGIEQNPNKLWVMKEFKRVLEQVETEDTEAREDFGEHLERIMDILHIESSDGLLTRYL